jgi:glycine/D-amino acid oxidase-like deaminating enzyme/nitrite reductase/ring-hydroxylating ferredoxin subunit
MEFSKAREEQDKELEALKKAGASVERSTGIPLKGFEKAPVLRYANQATFHPIRYLNGIAREISDNGGRIFADSAVMKVEELEDQVRLEVEGGLQITASHAVFATNSPINDWVELHSKMAPYRTYALAFSLPKGRLKDALYWYMDDPYRYVRLQPGSANTDYLIVGGADHKSGEANDGSVRFEALEAWTRQLVPATGGEAARWSGQVLDTIDYCGFIGRNPGNRRVFVATGDSGQGMTHGALAGIMIKNLVIYDATPYEQLYDPSRTPPSSVANFISENITAIKNYAEHLLPGDLKSLDDLKPGDGGIFRQGTSKIAVSKDAEGRLHACSAVCTHLGCIVHWNATEQCWDCPCHGSHFAPDGAVLNGPALAALAQAKIPSGDAG